MSGTVESEHGPSAGNADTDLLDARRVLAGDVAAFEGIVRRWQGRLINLAWRFCHDRTMAEDMAQDAFVKVFQALKTFRGESEFSTWVMAVTLNCYRSYLRTREPVFVGIDHLQPAGASPSALDVLQERERDAVLRQVVQTLPPRYREPIVLYYFNEMNLSETAKALGMPEGTLKARLSRARALLAKRYTNRVGRTKADPTNVGQTFRSGE